MAGISNVTIEIIINESEDDDLRNNFVGVFSSNQVFRFINLHKLIHEKNVQYPFTIMNSNNKKSTCWWSV